METRLTNLTWLVIVRGEKDIRFEVSGFLSRCISTLGPHLTSHFNVTRSTDASKQPSSTFGMDKRTLKRDLQSLSKTWKPDVDWSTAFLPVQSHAELASTLSSLLLATILASAFGMSIPAKECFDYVERYIETPPQSEEDLDCLNYILMVLEGVSYHGRRDVPHHLLEVDSYVSQRYALLHANATLEKIIEISTEETAIMYALSNPGIEADLTSVQQLLDQTDSEQQPGLHSRLVQKLVQSCLDREDVNLGTVFGDARGLANSDPALALILAPESGDPALANLAVDILSGKSHRSGAGSGGLLKRLASSYLCEISVDLLQKTRFLDCVPIDDQTAPILSRYPATTAVLRRILPRWKEILKYPRLVAKFSGCDVFPFQETLNNLPLDSQEYVALLALILRNAGEECQFSTWDAVLEHLPTCPREVITAMACGINGTLTKEMWDMRCDDVWLLAWMTLSTPRKGTSTWFDGVCNYLVRQGLAYVGAETIESSRIIRHCVDHSDWPLLHHIVTCHPSLHQVLIPHIARIPTTSNLFVHLMFELPASIPPSVLTTTFHTNASGKAFDACLVSARLASEVRAVYMKSLTTADWLSRKGLVLAWVVAGSSRDAAQFLLRLGGT